MPFPLPPSRSTLLSHPTGRRLDSEGLWRWWMRNLEESLVRMLRNVRESGKILKESQSLRMPEMSLKNHSRFLKSFASSLKNPKRISKESHKHLINISKESLKNLKRISKESQKNLEKHLSRIPKESQKNLINISKESLKNLKRIPKRIP